MRSALLSQAEIHALLYSGYSDSVEFDMPGNEPVAAVSGNAFTLSADVSPYLELMSSKVCIAPSLYFPLDPIVINCADPVVNRVAEVGITLKIREAKCREDIKSLLPSLRSAILITLSQKTSEELLSRHGKEKLASDLLLEIGRVFGAKPGRVEKGSLKIQTGNPVLEVLFSSLIVHQAAP
jgi:flagellar basal body-associated protein FliL